MRPKTVSTWNTEEARRAVDKFLRANGRSSHQFRNCQIKFGKSYGSCEVELEPGTRVLTQISATIGEPLDSRPGEGILTVSVWVSPSASGEMVQSGSKQPALIARILEKIYKENRSVDLESLCIKYGEKAWILRGDVHIIDTNGCLPEAASLSFLGALLTFRLGKAHVETNSNELVKIEVDHTNPKKLHLFHLPMLTSLSLTESGKLLAEPDFAEEETFQGKLLVGINESKELCYLHLTNPIDRAVLLEATRLAEDKCLQRIKFIKQLVAADDEERNIPVYTIREKQARKDGLEITLTQLENDLKIPELKLSSLSLKDSLGWDPLKR